MKEMLTTTRFKKGMMVLCAVLFVFSWSGCAVRSNTDVSNCADERETITNEADTEITNTPIQEHNSDDKLPPSKPSIMEQEAEPGEVLSVPKEWMFKIKEPKKQVKVSEEELEIIDHIYVNHILAGKVYEYTFSTQEDIEKILIWYLSLKLKTVTFKNEDQQPNNAEGSGEVYIFAYADGTKEDFAYYDDKYIWMITEDIWYEITN
jgi:hypothetical protein